MLIQRPKLCAKPLYLSSRLLPQPFWLIPKIAFDMQNYTKNDLYADSKQILCNL